MNEYKRPIDAVFLTAMGFYQRPGSSVWRRKFIVPEGCSERLWLYSLNRHFLSLVGLNFDPPTFHLSVGVCTQGKLQRIITELETWEYEEEDPQGEGLPEKIEEEVETGNPVG